MLWRTLLLLLIAIPLSAASSNLVIDVDRYVGVDRTEGDVVWEPLQLPQNLGEHLSDDYSEPIVVWIRFDVNAQNLDGYGNAVYIPRHNMTASVYLDDEYLGGTDQTVFGMAPMGWNIPLLLDLPLREDSEYLYIRLESGPSGVLLAPFYIGQRNELIDNFEYRYFIQVTSSQIAFVICALMGILSFWLWFRRKEDRLYLRFTLLCVCYCIQSAFGFLEFIPFDLRGWLFAVHTAGDWANYLLVSFVLFALGMNVPWLTKTLFWLAGAATVVHLVVPDTWFLPTAYVALGVQNLLVYGFGAWVVFKTVGVPVSSNIWFGLAFVGMFIFSGHDFYGVFLTTPEVYAEGYNLMHLSLPLLAIAFYSHLLNRFVTALDASEQLNQELETAAEEKHRLYRDLHDDVGSRLLTIMHQNENGSGRLAKEALESIRASLYSVNHADEPISVFSDDMLEEVELRLTSAGVQTDVEADLDRDTIVNADVAYHLKRIVREVVNNILHHAHASFVTTHISFRNSQLEIEVTDDGVGIDSEVVASSGLDNIQFRAEQIGARFELSENEPGTRFLLSLYIGQTSLTSVPTMNAQDA